MKRSKVDLDTILETEIGEFGKFQIRTLVLSAILAIFAGWIANEYVFTTARISTRCVIPECDGSQPEWSPDWISNAIPATSSSTYDNCQRFGNTSTQVESDVCPSSLFDTNTLQPCEAYVYENTHSVAYDFELACDEWRRSLIGTMRSVGLLIGLPITGYVSDRWGRRVAVTLAAFNKALVGILRSFSNSYIMFMLLEAVESIVSGGCFNSCYILLAEVTSPRYRVAVGGFMNTCMAIGFVTLGLIAWAVPNWRHLTLVLYIPQLLTLSYFWIISESVRWYIAKGRFIDAEAVLKKVAKSNGKQLSDTSLQALWSSAKEEKSKRLEEEKLRHQEPLLIVQVFRHKRILVRCIVAPIWWITSLFVYSGLSLNAVNLAGNSYLNFIAVAAVEIPGYWASVFLMEKIGRKPVLIGAYWTCAACQIAYVFIPEDLYAVPLIVYLIGKFAIAMVGAGLYIYTVELFPTRHRNSLIAFTTMISKLGAMIAPLTPAIGAQWFEDLPFLLYAGFALVSGALVFLTPETLGCKLPDTFEEASTIKREKKINKSTTE